MKVAILGGGGCFGLNLARHLLRRGHDVLGIGRSALRKRAFTLGAEEMGYRYRVFSVGRDNEFIAELLEAEQPSVIVNFAAQGEGAASFKASNWKYFFDTNALALVELTERLHGRPWLERFVQVSTSELYGSTEGRPADEEAPLKPSSPYAASKAAFDMHLLAISKNAGFPAVIVRPSNCYCPGQQLHRVVPKTFLFGLTGRRLELHGGGVQRKSYMSADDLSSAIEGLALHGGLGQIYNAGPAEPVSIRQLVEFCGHMLGIPFDRLAQIAPDRSGQDSCYWINSAKLRRAGWTPEVSLLQGLASVYDWVRDNLTALEGEPTDYQMRA